MHKKSVEQALNNYLERQAPKTSAPRKNKRPEKEVEKQVLEWCRKQDFHIAVVESKAVYSASAGRFLQGQAPSGFPDLVGLTLAGIFVAIELKAPGRRSTLRPAQREFLTQVISRNGFGIVTDSVEFLENSYQEFLRHKDPKTYLFSLLPSPKKSEQDSKLSG